MRFGRGGQPIFLPQDSFHMGQGYTTRKNAEDVLLFRRGKPERISKSVHEIIIAPRRDHSRKPEEFYERAEKYCPGPRLEMFTRFTRPGWSAWGNEATKFNEAAE
jgi:N6-adenosine-specific RNA methylase IME4